MRGPLKALVAIALLAGAPLGADPPPAWDTVVTYTEQGYPVQGNQAAPVRLVEFISYTCPHCATYAAQSHEPLQSGPVRQGRVAVEIRPFFRNAVDVVATMLALCGPKERFFDIHHSILATQETWLKPPLNPNAQQRWANPVFGERMKAVAEDLGLYRVMLDKGYAPVDLDRCLADQELANRHAVNTEAAMELDGVQGTPSFLINGKLQQAHSWPELSALLEAAAPRAAESAVEKP